ncbi:MAG TPA: glycoside hydrolase family 127 protein [Planctomycetes bacterium]|nr:glycoside hydrolase family 127 protein [Planctomycetota bacterium]
MMQSLRTLLLFLLLVQPLRAGDAAKLRPVDFSKVTIQSEFWSPRLEANRKATIPHCLEMCETTGRIDNFRHAAGVRPRGPFRGHIFHDSDVFKVLEGVAYSLHTHPDAKLEARLEEIVDLVRRSQQPDGYLNTWFIVKEPERRWQNLQHAHELYCAGHMFEAAVAHWRATGRRTFLDVACRYADYIDSVFGPGRRHGIAGHPEIELALVKLWRATGDERYLNLARFFVEEHGNAKHRKLFGAYCQDHAPVREQHEPLGHAVRFLYFYSGVADLAAVDGDPGYIKTMERLWQFIVNKKMYITGGVGVQGHGEGFARPYYLPNYDAYCETCASIAMVFWNHRLALLHGQGRFADLVERLLYNGALSGVSLDGSKFFYVNPLASRGNHHRRPWYGCACCPTNVVRFVASLGQYVYGQMADGAGVCVLQYVGGTATVPVGGGSVRLTQKTRYPWEGRVEIQVHPHTAEPFTIQVRIPGWCRGAVITLNGQPIEARPHDGFVSIRRQWTRGDTIVLDLPMPVRQVSADPRVEANVGRLAIMRGPVVYCLEDADNPSPVDQVAVAEGARFRTEFRPDLLGGVTVIQVTGRQQSIVEADDGLRTETRDVTLTAIPYYAWDNRQPGRMVVWVPTEPPKPDLRGATIAMLARVSSSHCWHADSPNALNDNVLPAKSNDQRIPRFTWWDHRGTTEWVQYEFAKPKTLDAAEVYWFDDTGRGYCRVPESWRLLWWDGEQWKPVEATSPYGTERDRFNRVHFHPVTTTALRLEVRLQPKFSGGILEWRLP